MYYHNFARIKFNHKIYLLGVKLNLILNQFYVLLLLVNIVQLIRTQN